MVNRKTEKDKRAKCFIDEFYSMNKPIAEVINNIKPIASFAAGDTYDLVRETNVHAHPIYRGYPSRVAPFIMLRAERGRSDALYQVMKTIDLNPCDNRKVNELVSIYPSVVNYIKKRIHNRGFNRAPIPYRFYILRRVYTYKPVFQLEYNPQGLIYLSFKDARIANPESLIANLISSYEEYTIGGVGLNENEQKRLEDESRTIEEEVKRYNIEGEDKKQFVKTRVNQSYYRTLLLRKYHKCCLCGVDDEHLLIASHIKPWAKSSGQERTDVNNGLLLCPNHDILFDNGYISFNDNGKILISKTINEKNKKLLNVSENMTIEMSSATKTYMIFHREKVYKK